MFSPFPEPADTVIVNGRIVVEGGELVGVDVPALVDAGGRDLRADAEAGLASDRADYFRRDDFRKG